MTLPTDAREALGLPKRGPLPKGSNLRRTGAAVIRAGERKLLNLLPQAIDRLEAGLNSEDEAISMNAAKQIMDRALGTPAKSSTPPSERPPRIEEKDASDLFKSLTKHLPASTMEKMHRIWLDGLKASGQLADVLDQDHDPDYLPPKSVRINDLE